MHHRTKAVALVGLMLIAIMAVGAQGKPLAPAIDLAQLTADQWADLNPKGAITSVTVKDKPVVKFYLTDSKGFGLKGLAAFKSKASTAALESYPNIAFTLAKLVPESKDRAPSKWVSYIVTAVPTVAVPDVAPRTPTTDNTGVLKDNGDGSYEYTFYRDVTKIQAFLDAYKYDAAKNQIKADLGDVSWQPALTHRLGIQFAGNARGTGTNTANAVTVATAVPMKNPINLIYDFVPSTGKTAPAARDVVAIQNCNECHDKLAFHGGGRVDTLYCVTCHTDQLKYGSAEATTTATGYSGTTNKINNAAVGDFPALIHRIHRGAELQKTGYNFANVKFNELGYSMLGGGQAMCTKCHANAAQAENYATKPTTLACGTCHDSANFTETGENHPAGKSTDKDCITCHTTTDVKEGHYTLNVTPHNPVVAKGLVNFTYEVKSAVASASDVKITFKIVADGKPVTFKAPASKMADPLAGFTGSPGFLLSYALPQDGVDGSKVKLIDYNNLGSGAANFQPISVSIANLLDPDQATAVGTLSAPDKDGYYVATVVGAKKIFPAGAKLRAVGLQGYFTQIMNQDMNEDGKVDAADNTPRHAISVVTAVKGDDVRRQVIDSAKCASCHEWFEGHGGNRVYQVQVCVQCHVPGLTTSGRGISDKALQAYSDAGTFTAKDLASLKSFGNDLPKPVVDGSNYALSFPQVTNNFKDMIHGIHAGKDRAEPIEIVRDRTPGAITIVNGGAIGFPGILSNCENCHTYNGYSGTPAAAFASRQIADNGAIKTTADAKASLATANPTDKMTSAFAAACVSCHDSTAAQGHVKLNGGQILVNRSDLVAGSETCVVCHGAGTEFDPVKAHK